MHCIHKSRDDTNADLFIFYYFRLRYGPKSQKVVEKEVESRNLAGSDVGDKGDPTPLVQEVLAQPQQALFEQMSEFFW